KLIGMKITVQNGVWVTQGKDEETLCKTDSTKQPHRIDLRPQKPGPGKPEVRGIYKREGDTLTISLGTVRKRDEREPILPALRPADFQAPSLLYLVLKRQKP